MNITRKRLDKIKKTKNQSKRRIHYKNKKGNNNKKLHKKKRKHSKNYKKYKKTQKQKKAYNLKNKSFRIKAKLKQLRKKKIKPIRGGGLSNLFGRGTTKSRQTAVYPKLHDKRKPTGVGKYGSMTSDIKLTEGTDGRPTPAGAGNPNPGPPPITKKHIPGLPTLTNKERAEKIRRLKNLQRGNTSDSTGPETNAYDNSDKYNELLTIVLDYFINSKNVSAETKERAEFLKNNMNALQNLSNEDSESGSQPDGSKKKKSLAYLKNLWKKTKESFKSKFKKKKSETIEYTDPEERKNIVKNLKDLDLFTEFNEYVTKQEQEDNIFEQYNTLPDIKTDADTDQGTDQDTDTNRKTVAQYTFLMNNQKQIKQAIETNATNDDDFTVDKFDKMFETTRFKFAPYPQKDIHAPQKAQIMVVKPVPYDLAIMPAPDPDSKVNTSRVIYNLKSQIKAAQKETGEKEEVSKKKKKKKSKRYEDSDDGNYIIKIDPNTPITELDNSAPSQDQQGGSSPLTQGISSAIYAILFSGIWTFENGRSDNELYKKLVALKRNSIWAGNDILDIYNLITNNEQSSAQKILENNHANNQFNTIYAFVKNVIIRLNSIDLQPVFCVWKNENTNTRDTRWMKVNGDYENEWKNYLQSKLSGEDVGEALSDATITDTFKEINPQIRSVIKGQETNCESNTNINNYVSYSRKSFSDKANDFNYGIINETFHKFDTINGVKETPDYPFSAEQIGAASPPETVLSLTDKCNFMIYIGKFSFKESLIHTAREKEENKSRSA